MAEQIIYALLGGVIPGIVWLVFWLREDRKKPEPKGLILKTFIFGMLAVVFVLPLQKFVDMSFPGSTFTAIVLWVLIEEAFKFFAAYFSALKTREDDDEGVDQLVYIITAALGFAALENALFIFGPLVDGDILGSILTGNSRFIGAMLLHVVSSSMVGVMLALTLLRGRFTRFVLGLIGFAGAVTFHTFFNLSLQKGTDSGMLVAFASVWAGAIVLLLLFEKAKTIAR